MAYGSYRALYSSSLDRLFAIVGSGVYEIFADKTWKLRGNINTSAGMCSIAENETQLIIVDGTDGWIYDLRADTLTQIVNLVDMIQYISIATGGTGYNVGDILTINDTSVTADATVQVTSVTAGVIDALGVVLLTKGRGYTTGIKTTTIKSTSGALGSGATINVEGLVDGGFNSGNQVIAIDGFFVKNEINSGRFNWSYLRDGFTWDLLDFATAEGTPDNIVAVNKVNNEIWLFGPKTIEIWYDTGDYVNGQFQRVHQGFLDIGIAAPWSSATLGNTIFWLGSDAQGHGIVWQAENYMPNRISTHAIEYVIAQISKSVGIDDAVGYCYQQEGHFYYVLNFTKGKRTLVYDYKTEMWHERGFWNDSIATMERHRGQCCTFCFGKVFLGDYENSNLYELDLDTYTDNGNQIRRVRTGPHIRQDRKRLFHQEFEIDLERGVGLNEGQGSNPMITLTSSDDGGKTFGNERQLTIGKQGKNLTRAHTHRLGYSRDRVYRVTVSDPVKCVLTGARADIVAERG